MASDSDLERINEAISRLSYEDHHPNQTPASPVPGQRAPERPKNQIFSSFLCIDFESTCIDADDPTLPNPRQLPKDQLRWFYPNEIIEWPVILLQWRISSHDRWELFEVARYRRFVKPVWRPILNQFCIQLTGITQDLVDQAMILRQVIGDFDINFVKFHNLFTPENRTVWVTDGPWDFRDHFVKATFLAGIHPNALPDYLCSPISLIDLRHLLRAFIPRVCTFPMPASLSLVDSLGAFGLEFEGHLHSGIDDAYNISRLLCEMVRFATARSAYPRWTFRVNSSLVLNRKRYFWMAGNFKCTWTLP